MQAVGDIAVAHTPVRHLPYHLPNSILAGMILHPFHISLQLGLGG